MSYIIKNIKTDDYVEINDYIDLEKNIEEDIELVNYESDFIYEYIMFMFGIEIQKNKENYCDFIIVQNYKNNKLKDFIGIRNNKLLLTSEIAENILEFLKNNNEYIIKTYNKTLKINFYESGNYIQCLILFNNNQYKYTKDIQTIKILIFNLENSYKKFHKMNKNI
jgi:hypothetical protein